MKIGEVAARAGVNIDTLRYYERRGLLAAPKRAAGSNYREYREDTVPLVRFIKRAQELGFTLSEIEELVSLRNGGKGMRRTKVRTLAEAKMNDIDRKLIQLQAIRSALFNLLESCACGAGTLTCPILQALEAGLDTPDADPLTRPGGDDRDTHSHETRTEPQEKEPT